VLEIEVKRQYHIRKDEGVIITLVAVFMLFVICAMAALSIDVVTLYTARSEAQMAADGAALAAARFLANSGVTSDTTGASLATAEGSNGPAKLMALQVAKMNLVGGQSLSNAEITVTYGGTYTNPTVSVAVRKASLPTFFARVWGSTTFTVAASATAEAYNPSGAEALSGGTGNTPVPVALTCVKPWLLPNIDPTSPLKQPIFVTSTGAINNPALLGYSTVGRGNNAQLHKICTTCVPTTPPPAAWQFYPGSQTSFPPPLTLPRCAAGFSAAQKSIAGCVQTTIACGSNPITPVSMESVGLTNTAIADAVNCLTNANNQGGADQIDPSFVDPPFEFLAGANNPVTAAIGNDVMVSSSLVTVPVFDVGPTAVVPPPASPGTVQIVGFVQLLLNADGNRTQNTGGGGGSPNGKIATQVINMVGCGTGWTGTPIMGNGASPVTVRLIAPPIS
jgi:hypothetical protein